jgi:type I restriction enzyme S subunit
MLNWPEIRFEDCVDILSGFPFKSEFFSDDPNDIPLVKGDNLHQGYVDWDGAKRWDKDDWSKLRKYQLQEGDVVVAMDRPWIEAGLKYSWIKKGDPKGLLVQRISRLRGINGLDTTFLRYIVGSPQFSAYLQSVVTGVNIPHISASQILRFSFNLPPLPTQKKIASILSAYDELIENNNQRIQLLEEMAEEIYKEWFVRMRFPSYEQGKWFDKEGNEVPQGTEGSLPEGWERKRLGDILAPVKRNGKLKTDEYSSTGAFPIVDQGDGLIAGYTDIEAFVQTQLPIVVFGDHTRRVKFVDFPFVSGADGTQLLYPTDKSLLPTFFLLTVKRIDLSNFHYARHYKFLKQESVVIPERTLVINYNELTAPFLKEIDLLRNKNQVLQETRDLLLPRLISGKLSVEGLNVGKAELNMATEPAIQYGK